MTSGGKAGETTALFRWIAPNDTDLTTESVITIDVGTSLGVTAAQKGGVTVETVNATVEGILGKGKSRKKHTSEAALVGVSAITAEVKGMDAEAKVEAGFKAFDNAGTIKAASLGTVAIAVDGDTLPNRATSEAATTRAELYNGTEGTAGSMIKLKGDLSFVSVVNAVAACGDTTSNTFKIADDKMSASRNIQAVFDVSSAAAARLPILHPCQGRHGDPQGALHDRH